MAKKQNSKATQTAFQKVEEFHKAFGHPVSKEVKNIDPFRARLRLNLILEEVKELIEAVSNYAPTYKHLNTAATHIDRAMSLVKSCSDEELANTDLVAVADALTDIEYVVCGAAHEYGIDLDATMAEVHKSNMTKLDENGNPIYNDVGKVIKSDKYVPPDLPSVLNFPQEVAESKEIEAIEEE